MNLPLVGRVAAGTPVLAVANVEEHLTVGTEIAGGEDSYALDRARREHDRRRHPRRGHRGGEPPEDAANGTIVVARIENEHTGESEVTVKRFFREAGRIRLQPENSTMEPIYARELDLEGVVVAVIRLLK